MNRSVGVNPFVTLLSLAAFSSLLGLPGALLAIPMAAIIQLLLDRFVWTADTSDNQQGMGRDYASVLKDITDPSAAINPDAVGYTVTLTNGTATVGTR